MSDLHTHTHGHVSSDLLMEVQSDSSLQKPSISVSDNDVQINIACEIPLSVRADLTCSFYTEDVLLHRSVSQKSRSGEKHLCVFYLTHNELFTRSVNSRNLSCDYYINTEPEIRSPRSDTHTIRDQYLVRRSEFICENNLLLHCEFVPRSKTISSLRSSDSPK
ncbi:unnamed protein product [Leuciscus chuanchicus]